MKLPLLPAVAFLFAVGVPAVNGAVDAETGKKKKIIGLAVNGGSFSAGNSIGGFMRGFQQQRVTIDGEQRPAMEAFTYVSGLSGGNLPSMTYHYAQGTTSDEILDAAGNSDPSKITMEDLEVIPEKSLFTPYVTNVTPMFALSMFYALLGIDNVATIWPVILSFHFLQPKGITMGTKMVDAKIRDDVKSTPICMASMFGPAESFPEYEYKTMSRAMMIELAIQHVDRLEKVDFAGLYPENEFYEMDNDYLLELAEKHNYQFPFPAFLTEKGLEVPFSNEVVMKFDVVNQTIDDVKFKPVDVSFEELSSDSEPFTIEKMLGMATDTLVIYGQIYGEQFDLWNTLPEQIANPILADIPTADGGKRKMAFSDGGYVEALAIAPLVKKKADHIISFFNPPSGPDGLFAYFGYFGMVDLRSIPFVLDYFTLANGKFVHMFDLYNDEGENIMLKAVEDFNSLLAAGEPLIITLKNVKVIDNPFFGIEGGWTLDLTIVYGVGVPMKFVEQVPEGIVTPPIGKNVTEKRYGLNYFTNEDFKTVPNVAPEAVSIEDISLPIPFTNETVEFKFPNLGQNLPVKEARMTQILNSWIIGHAWDNELKGADGEVKFEGFKKILEGAYYDDEGGPSSFGDGGPSSSGFSISSAPIVSVVTAVAAMMYLAV